MEGAPTASHHSPKHDRGDMTTRSQVTPFETESVTVTSRDFARWYEAYLDCGYAEWGDYAEMHSIERLTSATHDPTTELDLFQVVLRGRVAGVALLERLINLDGDQPIPATGLVLVPHAVRGNGIGRALLYKLEAVAAAKGDTELWGMSLAPSSRTDRTTRTLLKAGYAEGGLGLRQEMERTLAHGLAARHPVPTGYQLEVATTIPDLTVLTELSRAITDGMKETYPNEPLLAPDEFTAESVRHTLEVAEDLGQRTFLGLLRTNDEGMLVGFATIALSSHGDVHDDMTWVHPDHRDPSTVNAVHAAALGAAVDAYPSPPGLPRPRAVTPIDTGSWLISANKLLGYRDAIYLRWWHKNLSP